jgi:hypothetical protein
MKKNLSNEEIIKKYNETKVREKRYWVKNTLMLKKAAEAGIVVTNKEIDEYLKLKK